MERKRERVLLLVVFFVKLEYIVEWTVCVSDLARRCHEGKPLKNDFCFTSDS